MSGDAHAPVGGVSSLVSGASLPVHQRFLALDRTVRGRAPGAPALRELANATATTRGREVVVGLALGSGVFGAGSLRPRQLREMPAFAGDVLDVSVSHGDVLVELGGRTAAAVEAAAGQLVASLPSWRARWWIDGFRAENRVEGGRGLARNPFHFTEGFGNPATEREIANRALVRADQGEPDWAVGGSYQVVRNIRFAIELWDRDSVEDQEKIIGRRRDGRWLDGTPVGEDPNFATDPQGKLTPLDSHVRLAAPDRRNPPPIVRRGYSYDRGNGDKGLIFSCFQRDLTKGFEAVQKRLEGEAMAKYLLTTGGGYFFAPPPGDDWIDRAFHQ
ncbi:Dyp-type peroxidase [Streptomyces sp. NPDC019396]|uniref:Dyp-type peroxidase n=1 Tax=Streptomyces sp. NPDC019396 TaxID=3154687 RepID=UPI0033D5FDFA